MVKIYRALRIIIIEEQRGEMDGQVEEQESKPGYRSPTGIEEEDKQLLQETLQVPVPTVDNKRHKLIQLEEQKIGTNSLGGKKNSKTKGSNRIFQSVEAADQLDKSKAQFTSDSKRKIQQDLDFQKKYKTTINRNEDEESDNMSENDKHDGQMFSDYQQRPYHSELGGKAAKQHRSRSFLSMFFEQNEVFSFIAENQYGGAGDTNQQTHYSEHGKGLKYFDLDKIVGATPILSSKLISEESASEKLLSPFEVYIALVKGYCVILILIIPRAFVTGGYIMTAILLIASGVISTLCANLLVKAGLQSQLASYSELTGEKLGPKWRIAVDCCISMAQYSFTVSHISFIVTSLQTTVEAQFGVQTNPLIYLIGSCIVLTLISWVEDIKKFSSTFLVGNLLIFATVLTVSFYCIWLLTVQGPGPPIEAFDSTGVWSTIGFAIYSYEGIGIVMPVMSKAQHPEKFSNCLIAAIITLCCIFVFFGELTAITFGSGLTEPFITQMLPSHNWGVSLIKIAFCGNLICSYPITIKPTNEILENYLFPKKSSTPQQTISPTVSPTVLSSPNFGRNAARAPVPQSPGQGKFSYYGSRISRCFVVVSAAILGFVLAKDMDKFLGLLGALLGSPMAMTIPALIHYKAVATNKCWKALDILIIILSLFTLVFSTGLSLQAWIKSEE